MTQVVILAGGMGSRLKAVTGDLPKPLAPVAGSTLLGRQLDLIARSAMSFTLIFTQWHGVVGSAFLGLLDWFCWFHR